MTENKKKNTPGTFSEEERSAMRQRAKELRENNDEKALLAKIAEMPEPDRSMATKIHEIVKVTAPHLTPKTWYGMPAYAKANGKVVCFFQNAQKFNYPYSTFGFNDGANLNEGNMWPISFALTRLTAAEEKRIAELVAKAAS